MLGELNRIRNGERTKKIKENDNKNPVDYCSSFPFELSLLD